MKDEPLKIKVTKIKNKWHCRLFLNGKLYEELACKCKSDISICIRYMLRWYDKLGFAGTYSPMADASRSRCNIIRETSFGVERIFPSKNYLGKLK